MERTCNLPYKLAGNTLKIRQQDLHSSSHDISFPLIKVRYELSYLIIEYNE